MPNKAVLVVDDDQEILGVIRETLTRDGWTIHEASQLEEALNLWGSLERKPQVALLDMRMIGPDDGLKLARKLRNSSPETKIVIVSGYFSDEERYPHEFYYLDKPFKLNELLILCNGMLRLHEIEKTPH